MLPGLLQRRWLSTSRATKTSPNPFFSPSLSLLFGRVPSAAIHPVHVISTDVLRVRILIHYVIVLHYITLTKAIAAIRNRSFANGVHTPAREER